MTNFPRLKERKSRKNVGDQWAEVSHAVRLGPDDHDAKRQIPHCLLMLEFAVHRDQGIKPAGSSPQQLSVRDARPPKALDRSDLVFGQFQNEVVR